MLISGLTKLLRITEEIALPRSGTSPRCHSADLPGAEVWRSRRDTVDKVLINYYHILSCRGELRAARGGSNHPPRVRGELEAPWHDAPAADTGGRLAIRARGLLDQMSFHYRLYNRQCWVVSWYRHPHRMVVVRLETRSAFCTAN